MKELRAALPVQADFRFLLNLYPGQNAAVMNMGEHLLSLLQNDGIKIVSMEVNSRDLDAIFLAAPFHQELSSVLVNCSRKLKPGGQVLMCFENSESLKRIKNLRTDILRQGLSYRKARVTAQKAGFTVRGAYGLYDSLDEPRYFVPLEDRHAVNYFFNDMLTPYSSSALHLIKISKWLVAFKLISYLFTDLCLVLDLPC